MIIIGKWIILSLEVRMKKYLFILLSFIVVTAPAFAAVSTDEIMSEAYIRNHGNSAEMARLMDLQNRQINGKPAKFRDSDPDWYTTDKRVKYIRKFFQYADCGLDSETFGSDEIKYTTRYDAL